jgi:hypothetical protein
MPKSALTIVSAGLLVVSSAARAAAINACDLNGDGVVNAADVQAAINMAIGISPCTADIVGEKVCNIIVVQRVVKASLGEECLEGEGKHTVSLRWTASTSTGVTGYRVYRGSKPGSYKPLVTVGKVTSYVDRAVVSGKTYYYVVTAVNSAGESTYSSECQAVIPIP